MHFERRLNLFAWKKDTSNRNGTLRFTAGLYDWFARGSLSVPAPILPVFFDTDRTMLQNVFRFVSEFHGSGFQKFEGRKMGETIYGLPGSSKGGSSRSTRQKSRLVRRFYSGSTTDFLYFPASGTSRQAARRYN